MHEKERNDICLKVICIIEELILWRREGKVRIDAILRECECECECDCAGICYSSVTTNAGIVSQHIYDDRLLMFLLLGLTTHSSEYLKREEQEEYQNMLRARD